MKLSKEQLTFFCSEVLDEFGWCEEIAQTGIDPLIYVRDEISIMRRHIKRLEKSLEMRIAAEQSVQSDICPALTSGGHEWHIKNNSETCLHCGTCR